MSDRTLQLANLRTVTPDDDEARQWLREELARGPYQEAEPNLIERVVTAVLEWLGSLFANLRPLDAGPGTLLLALGAALLIGVAVWLIKPRLNARRKRTGDDVFAGDRFRTATEHRQLALAAAAALDWDTALTERLRAVIRSAEERGIIDRQPGRTAGETAVQLRSAFGGEADGMSWFADRFNEVHYGSQSAKDVDYRRATTIDDQLVAARPTPQQQATTLAAPR